MAITLRRARQFSRFLSLLHSGNLIGGNAQRLSSAGGTCVTPRHALNNARRNLQRRAMHDLKIKDGVVQSSIKRNEPGLEQKVDRKGPIPCSFLQNLLIYLPGGISVDEHNSLLFLSDSYHHRIIVFNGDGEVQDCIGSSPGFEDGDFEYSKLKSPAASYYDDSEKCLYFVDSENHSIRRADLTKRVLETLHPLNKRSQRNGGWSWLMNKIGLGGDIDSKHAGFHSTSLAFPWHLMKSTDGNFLVINHSFTTLWVMDPSSGEIKGEVQGSSNILEAYGDIIAKKASLSKQLPPEWVQEQSNSCIALDGILSARLMSSLATFKKDIIVCDTVRQQVVKYNKESGFSIFQFSKLENLGLLYWLPSSLESVYTIGDIHHGPDADHVESFNLLPGTVDIKLNVNTDLDFELVEKLQEGCIWREARGAAVEVSGADRKAASTEKVTATQDFYNELGKIVVDSSTSDLSIEKADSVSASICQNDDGAEIDCSVNISPGTSEVVIYAALYLKLRSYPNGERKSQEENAAKIADMLISRKHESTEKHQCLKFLLNSNQDLTKLVLMRPLHVRIKFETLDHPKTENNQDFILTDSSIEVNVSLKLPRQ